MRSPLRRTRRPVSGVLDKGGADPEGAGAKVSQLAKVSPLDWTGLRALRVAVGVMGWPSIG